MADDNLENVEPTSTWKFLVALGMILILFLAIQGYRSWDAKRQTEANKYNGFDFAHSADGFWVTQIEVDGQTYNIPFYYHPRDTENVTLDTTAAWPILTSRPKQVIISVSADASSQVVVAGVELAKVTGERYNLLDIPTSSALSSKGNTTLDIPIVTCANATNTTTVLQFVQSDRNAIVRDGYCVVLLYSSNEESVRVADKFAYRLLRIIQ